MRTLAGVVVVMVAVVLTGFTTLTTAAAGEDSAKASAAAKVAKPALVTREEWGSQPQAIPEARKHTPQFITIHHAGVNWKPGRDPAELVRNMQKWGQREKSWPDLPYHFMIAPDGRIFEARKLEYEPESNTKYDLQATSAWS
jgi:hypothetical protein